MSHRLAFMTLKLADAGSGRGRVDSEARSSPYSCVLPIL